MPNLQLAAVPHPLGGIDPKLARAKAEAIVDRVIEALTCDPSPPARRSVPAAGAVVSAPGDLDAFQDFAVAEAWSDGLPVLPPTEPRVTRLLGVRTANRGEVIATLAPRRGIATLEAVAVNAALAGALPEHLPVIVAAVRAVAEPRFNLNAIQTTTHPCTPLVIVNGPIAARLEINAGANALGQGHRANAVIRPGAAPRAPERRRRAAGAGGPRDAGPPGEVLLLRCRERGGLAGTAATTGSNNIYLGGEPLVILGPEHAQTFATSGWSKADLKRAIWERARVRLDRFSRENRERFAVTDPARFKDRPADAEVALCGSPDDLMLIVAGGPGKHSAIVPTFGSTRSVTVRIEA